MTKEILFLNVIAWGLLAGCALWAHNGLAAAACGTMTTTNVLALIEALMDWSEA